MIWRLISFLVLFDAALITELYGFIFLGKISLDVSDIWLSCVVVQMYADEGFFFDWHVRIETNQLQKKGQDRNM